MITDDQIISEIVASDIQELIGGPVPSHLSGREVHVFPANQQPIRDIVSRNLKEFYGILPSRD